MWRPMLVAAASTYCRSAEPSSSGGVPTPMNCSVPCATARGMSVVNCSRPAATLRAHDLRQARLVDRDAAVVEHADLLRVHVQADDVVAHFGQAGAGDQADVTGADNGKAAARQRTAAPTPPAPVTFTSRPLR
jgi:hypothetical protein